MSCDNKFKFLEKIKFTFCNKNFVKFDLPDEFKDINVLKKYLPYLHGMFLSKYNGKTDFRVISTKIRCGDNSIIGNYGDAILTPMFGDSSWTLNQKAVNKNHKHTLSYINNIKFLEANETRIKILFDTSAFSPGNNAVLLLLRGYASMFIKEVEYFHLYYIIILKSEDDNSPIIIKLDQF